jgi:alkylhydroperoxidase/carboxymuconolactone decarboxylase family protein YurZ
MVVPMSHFLPFSTEVKRQLEGCPSQPSGAPGIMAAHHHPAMEGPMGQMKEFAGVYYREGALDPKTMQLVALAAMAAAGCTS